MVEMWDSRSCLYEGDRESEVLNVLRESMLRWRRRKLTIEFSEVLRRSSVSCKWVGSSQRIKDVVGEYVWIEGSHDTYLQYRRYMTKNKDWEASVVFLEQAMGSSCWEWSVGSR